MDSEVVDNRCGRHDSSSAYSAGVPLMVVLTGVDGTGPPTGDRPRRETAAGWRRAKSGESATARSALDKGAAGTRAAAE